MRIADFQADADIVGRRIRVAWRFVLEGSDTLADIPPVRLRRKTHDFEFPAASPGDDPLLVYASGSFPPAPSPPSLTVTDLPAWQTRDGAALTVGEAVSVASAYAGQPVEVLRVSTQTLLDASGTPVSRRVEVLDAGLLPERLRPATTYYYQLVNLALLPNDPDVEHRATATATEIHGMGRMLYESLPEIYRRHDVVRRQAVAGSSSVPELSVGAGQLRRFVDLFGTSLDLMRSTAAGLANLRDIDNIDYRYLPLLARWIGWDLSFDQSIPLQRNEIKSASHLYRSVGTVPAIQAIVDRYTGWSTQITEFAQHIARANLPAQLNIFALAETASGWRGADDAAPVLGFGPGSDRAAGTVGGPATLTGTLAEPFALRPGMELSVASDDERPQVVRFGAGDFATVGAATAAEVAAAINRALSEVEAEAVGGKIALRSDSVGPDAALEVAAPPTSLVTLDSAPAGRLSTLVDGQGRLRLFYAAADPTAPTPARISYKTFVAGAWRNAALAFQTPGKAQADPVAMEQPDGQILLAWIEQPSTGQSLLRVARGGVPQAQPARLVGQRTAPFAIPAGARLTLRGAWAGADTIAFAPGDFANPQRATAAEVVAAINARTTHALASAQPNGVIALQSNDTGPTARIEIDLRGSVATQALGFDARTAPATGSWDDALDWRPAPQDMGAAPAGWHADLHGLVDRNGAPWLFWATHDGTQWNVVGARWDGAAWAAAETLAAGGGGNREPFALLDATGRIWLFWSQRQGVGTPEDVWVLRRRIFDPAAGPAGAWSAEAPVPVPPAPTRAADRQPAAVLLPTGDLRLFFRSSRAGGPDIWALTMSAAEVVGAFDAVAPGAAADHAPAPVLLGGAQWLIYRSDRHVPLAQVAPPALTGAALAPTLSARLPSAGTLRRYAGTTSAVPSDNTRLARRRQWDDLTAYTPQRPAGLARGEALRDDELYTRGTIGLYVSRAASDDVLSEQEVGRLRQLLARFLPINIRAVVILAPPATTELVYRPGADIGENFEDRYPHVEYYGGVVESVAAALPERQQLLSNDADNQSADPNDLATLRRRTYGPPPE